jgi:hypothetical protein
VANSLAAFSETGVRAAGRVMAHPVVERLIAALAAVPNKMPLNGIAGSIPSSRIGSTPIILRMPPSVLQAGGNSLLARVAVLFHFFDITTNYFSGRTWFEWHCSISW